MQSHHSENRRLLAIITLAMPLLVSGSVGSLQQCKNEWGNQIKKIEYSLYGFLIRLNNVGGRITT